MLLIHHVHVESGKTAEEIQLENEEKLLKEVTERKKLQSDYELAKGIVYKEAMKTSWVAPTYLRSSSQEERDVIRTKYHIIATGMDIPPPITTFRVRNTT